MELAGRVAIVPVDQVVLEQRAPVRDDRRQDLVVDGGKNVLYQPLA